MNRITCDFDLCQFDMTGLQRLDVSITHYGNDSYKFVAAFKLDCNEETEVVISRGHPIIVAIQCERPITIKYAGRDSVLVYQDEF